MAASNDIQTSVTPSGIKVVTQYKPNASTTSLAMMIEVGSRDEGPDESGAAHFLEHMLFRGTRNRSDIEVDRVTDRLTTQLNAWTSRAQTCMHGSCSADDLARAFAFQGELLLRSTVPDDLTDIEREIIHEEIRRRADMPATLLYGAVARALAGTHPLARPITGTHASIDGIDADMLRRFHERWYRPDLLTVSCAGDHAHEDVAAMAEAFLFTRHGTRPPIETRNTPTRIVQFPAVVIPRPSAQAHVAVAGFGPTLGSPEHAAAKIAITAIGGMRAGRLRASVRKTHGLSYSTGGNLSDELHDVGWWNVYAATSPERAHEAAEVLHAQLDLALSDLADAEVDAARDKLIRRARRSYDGQAAAMRRNAIAVSQGRLPVTLAAHLRNLEAATPDAVREALHLMAGADRATAVVGPFGENDAGSFNYS